MTDEQLMTRSIHLRHPVRIVEETMRKMTIACIRNVPVIQLSGFVGMISIDDVGKSQITF